MQLEQKLLFLDIRTSDFTISTIVKATSTKQKKHNLKNNEIFDKRMANATPV